MSYHNLVLGDSSLDYDGGVVLVGMVVCDELYDSCDDALFALPSVVE